MSRLSSVELLRILSMFFVVLLHFNRWGINMTILEMSGDLTVDNSIGHFLESIAIVAVDVFVLISGYFGIRMKMKGLLKLYLICFCWGLISYLLYCLVGHPFVWKSLFARFFAFTHNKWWFIIAYLYLYLASPFINVAIEHLQKRQFLIILILYLFSTLYFGYFQDMGDNRIGMSFAQFVLLYLVGRFIFKFIPISSLVRRRKQIVLSWFVCTIITFCLAVLNQRWFHLHYSFLRPYTYNSPWVIGASICLLCFAISYTYKNETINKLAGSVLSAYLLQDSSYWGYQWLYPFVHSLLSPLALVSKYLSLILLSFLFLFFCVLFDLFLNRLFYRPVLRLYDQQIMPYERVMRDKLEEMICRRM